MVGGLIVSITSVGSGSLMIVVLFAVRPPDAGGGEKRLVGTDLTQAVPLTGRRRRSARSPSATSALSVTTSLMIGSMPAVIVGATLSSSVPDRYIRPVIAFVIFASGLKYAGLGATALGWVLCGVLLAAGVL